MGLKVNLSEPKEKKSFKRREMLKKNKNVEGLKEKVIFPPNSSDWLYHIFLLSLM